MAGSHTICLQLFLTVAALLGQSTAIRWPGPSAKISPLRNKQQTKASDGYGPVSCVPNTPQIPNYIQPMKIDPKRILGKWYRNSDWFVGMEGTSVHANIITTYNNLFNDTLTLYPGSNTPAVAFEVLGAYYDLTQNQCTNISFGGLEYATVDGQLQGIQFTEGTNGVDTTVVLSTDYDTYAVYYNCERYDVNSGICASPYVYIDTRQPMNLVSFTTVTAVNDVINRILAPYCFTPDMPRKAAFWGGVPDCPVQSAPTSACYKSLRDAYRYLGNPGNPNFTN